MKSEEVPTTAPWPRPGTPRRQQYGWSGHLRRTLSTLSPNIATLWHRLLEATRPVFWVLLRVLPPRGHAVIHGWPALEGNVVELLPTLERRYRGSIYWLVDQDPDVARRYASHRRLMRVRVVPKNSTRGVMYATTAELTFFTHGLFTAVRPPSNRLVVNLWHGDGPKSTTHAKDAASTVAVTGALMWKAYKARTFGLRDEDVAWTGNPRTDALTRGLAPEQWARLQLDPGRPLVLWLPTYRVGRNAEGLVWENGSPLSAQDDLRGLRDVVATADVSMIVKPHPMDRDDYSALGIRVLTDAELRDADVGFYELLGSCDAVISDTSSVWVDYLALDRPVAFFLPDIGELARTRGFNVPDLLEILPGPVLRDVRQFGDFLEAVIQDPEDPELRRTAVRERIGVAPLGKASERLLDWLDAYQVARARPPLFTRPVESYRSGGTDDDC